MARSQSNTVLKVLGVGAAVIAGGAAFGYLFGGAHLSHTPEQTSQPPVSTILPPAPKLNPSSIHPHLANGNYTAPGAPHIVIEEQSQPILRRVAPPRVPAADPEATQEAPPKEALPSAETTPTDTTQPKTGDTSGTPLTPDTNSGGTIPVVTPPPPSPAPADPDFEHINGAPKPTPSTADPENGQQGDKPPGAKADTGGAQFRVQTGAYTDESSARSAADTLRSQGYPTSTRSERDGDHLVYKVQVGAYHSKTGATKAADSLQKKGYSAFISPVEP